MIVNLRGTSGSGKSTIAFAIMAKSLEKTAITVPGTRGELIQGYEMRVSEAPYYKKLRVVGKYETQCGGCDGINTQNETERRVRTWHGEGYHVLFEGLLISHIYGRWAQVAKDCKPFRFVFLDTPLDVCIERVKQRRLSKGNDKPLNTDNTVQKWKDARRVFDKAKADGLEPVWMNSDTAAEEILGWMRAYEV